MAREIYEGKMKLCDNCWNCMGPRWNWGDNEQFKNSINHVWSGIMSVWGLNQNMAIFHRIFLVSSSYGYTITPSLTLLTRATDWPWPRLATSVTSSYIAAKDERDYFCRFSTALAKVNQFGIYTSHFYWFPSNYHYIALFIAVWFRIFQSVYIVHFGWLDGGRGLQLTKRVPLTLYLFIVVWFLFSKCLQSSLWLGR